MMLPASGPYIGAYASAGVTFSQSAPLATYVVDGLAFIPSSGGTADCSPPEQQTPSYAPSSGGSFTLAGQTLAFGQCQ